MGLIVAAGAEELHTSDGLAIGAWIGPSALEIVTAAPDPHTGAACFHHPILSVGESQKSGGYVGRWSYANYFTGWNGGTYRTVFKLCDNDDIRYVGWQYVGGQTQKSRLTLFKGGSPPVVLAAEGAFASAGYWNQIKIECASGHWTFWVNFPGSTDGWEELFTYDDSGNFESLTFSGMSLSGSSNETKGAQYIDQWIDDCLHWIGDEGDEWESRLPADAFPRISAAHMPTANGEWDDLDEIPPDHASQVGAEDDDAYYAVEALKEAPEDYTAEIIQTVMITRVDGPEGGEQAEFSKFNLWDGADVYLDSEEAGQRVQFGYENTDQFWTIAGYYPWTPTTDGEQNWTEELFNACQYGGHVLANLTDQLTVQVIYFGIEHEWPAPGAPGVVALSGTIAVASSLTAELYRARPISGQISAISALAGELFRTRPLVGQIDAVASVSGNLYLTWALSGTITSTSTLTAILHRYRGLSGEIAAVASLSATLHRIRGVWGRVDAVATVVGNLYVTWHLQGTIDAVSYLVATLEAIAAEVVRPPVGKATDDEALIAASRVVERLAAYGITATPILPGRGDASHIPLGSGRVSHHPPGLASGQDVDVPRSGSAGVAETTEGAGTSPHVPSGEGHATPQLPKGTVEGEHTEEGEAETDQAPQSGKVG